MGALQKLDGSLATTALESVTALEPVTAGRLVGAFLSGKSPRTLKAYRQDLETFRAFTGGPQRPSEPQPLGLVAKLVSRHEPGPGDQIHDAQPVAVATL